MSQTRKDKKQSRVSIVRVAFNRIGAPLLFFYRPAVNLVVCRLRHVGGLCSPLILPKRSVGTICEYLSMVNQTRFRAGFMSRKGAKRVPIMRPTAIVTSALWS